MEPITAVADPPKKAKLPKKERHTSEVKTAKPADITMPPLSEKPAPMPTDVNRVQTIEKPLDPDYMAALAFNEEPVVIVVSPGTEKFAPSHVECWVNGKGIEVLIGNRWFEFKAIPVGKRVVTKRKYVEVLLKMRRQDIKTQVIRRPGEDPENKLERTEATVHGISIVHDPAGGKGVEWFNRLLALQ